MLTKAPHINLCEARWRDHCDLGLLYYIGNTTREPLLTSMSCEWGFYLNGQTCQVESLVNPTISLKQVLFKNKIIIICIFTFITFRYTYHHAVKTAVDLCARVKSASYILFLAFMYSFSTSTIICSCFSFRRSLCKQYLCGD